jgi:hypothetical protein
MIADQRPSKMRNDGWRLAATVAGTVSLAVFLGCMSLNIGGRTYQSSDASPADSIFEQEGVVHVRGDSELDIYYPVAYQHPPNLVLNDDAQPCEIVAQKEDHFRVHNPRGRQVEVKWKARGVRGPAPGAPEAQAATTASTSAAPPDPDPTPSSKAASRADSKPAQ